MATSGNLEFQTRPILLPSLLLTYIKLHAKYESNPIRTFELLRTHENLYGS